MILIEKNPINWRMERIQSELIENAECDMIIYIFIL